MTRPNTLTPAEVHGIAAVHAHLSAETFLENVTAPEYTAATALRMYFADNDLCDIAEHLDNLPEFCMVPFEIIERGVFSFAATLLANDSIDPAFAERRAIMYRALADLCRFIEGKPQISDAEAVAELLAEYEDNDIAESNHLPVDETWCDDEIMMHLCTIRIQLKRLKAEDLERGRQSLKKWDIDLENDDGITVSIKGIQASTAAQAEIAARDIVAPFPQWRVTGIN